MPIYEDGALADVGEKNEISLVLVANGGLAAGTGIDSSRSMPRAGVIKSVIMSLGGKGSNGDTIVDINKHIPTKPITTQRDNTAGTTIYTTQGNRPTVAGTTGQATQNATIEATLPDVIAFVEGDFFSIDIDAKTAQSSSLSVLIRCEYTD